MDSTYERDAEEIIAKIQGPPIVDANARHYIAAAIRARGTAKSVDGLRGGDVVGELPGLEVVAVDGGMVRLKLRGTNREFERPIELVSRWKARK